MSPDDIRELIRELIQAVEIVMQSGEELSDEFQGQLAETLMLLLERLEAAETPQAPQIPEGPYPSSNVNGFRYNPETGELFVQFHGPYPQAAGSIYKYDKVPKFVYDIFSRGAIGPRTSGRNRYHTWHRGVTPSLGGSLNALLKAGGYQYQRLS